MEKQVLKFAGNYEIRDIRPGSRVTVLPHARISLRAERGGIWLFINESHYVKFGDLDPPFVGRLLGSYLLETASFLATINPEGVVYAALNELLNTEPASLEISAKDDGLEFVYQNTDYDLTFAGRYTFGLNIIPHFRIAAAS